MREGKNTIPEHSENVEHNSTGQHLLSNNRNTSNRLIFWSLLSWAIANTYVRMYICMYTSSSFHSFFRRCDSLLYILMVNILIYLHFNLVLRKHVAVYNKHLNCCLIPKSTLIQILLRSILTKRTQRQLFHTKKILCSQNVLSLFPIWCISVYRKSSHMTLQTPMHQLPGVRGY